jgi:hypothetical protein
MIKKQESVKLRAVVVVIVEKDGVWSSTTQTTLMPTINKVV